MPSTPSTRIADASAGISTINGTVMALAFQTANPFPQTNTYCVRTLTNRQTWIQCATDCFPSTDADQQKGIGMFFTFDGSNGNCYCNKPGAATCNLSVVVFSKTCLRSFSCTDWWQLMDETGKTPRGVELGDCVKQTANYGTSMAVYDASGRNCYPKFFKPQNGATTSKIWSGYSTTCPY
ncbi:hypothetical protein BCR33DRAFT_717177, partial [Rhizoclosmatium globosum]